MGDGQIELVFAASIEYRQRGVGEVLELVNIKVEYSATIHDPIWHICA